MTVYTNNTPQATQQIAFTQPLILGNFQYLDTALKQDHSFNGNEVAVGLAPGNHQTISMPNQPSDIIGALPTGIAQKMYTIGANIFSWDGTNKNPVSAVYRQGTIVITNVNQLIFTMPANCIGFLTVTGNSVTVPMSSNFIFASTSLTTPPAFPAWATLIGSDNSSDVRSFVTGNGFYLFRVGGSNYSAAYKLIYWPM